MEFEPAHQRTARVEYKQSQVDGWTDQHLGSMRM